MKMIHVKSILLQLFAIAVVFIQTSAASEMRNSTLSTEAMDEMIQQIEGYQLQITLPIHHVLDGLRSRKLKAIDINSKTAGTFKKNRRFVEKLLEIFKPRMKPKEIVRELKLLSNSSETSRAATSIDRVLIKYMESREYSSSEIDEFGNRLAKDLNETQRDLDDELEESRNFVVLLLTKDFNHLSSVIESKLDEKFRNSRARELQQEFKHGQEIFTESLNQRNLNLEKSMTKLFDILKINRGEAEPILTNIGID
jgi:hypothetical protein